MTDCDNCSRLKAEIRTLQKARCREKSVLRKKQKNAQRLDIQIKHLTNALIAIQTISIKPCDEKVGENLSCGLMKKIAGKALLGKGQSKVRARSEYEGE